MVVRTRIDLAFAALLLAGWIVGLPPLTRGMAPDASPVGKWENTGKEDWVLDLKADGTGTHYLIRQSDGTLFSPVQVTWNPANDGSGNYILKGKRFEGDCRMHLKNDNGNMSVRRNSDGNLWVFKPR